MYKVESVVFREAVRMPPAGSKREIHMSNAPDGQQFRVLYDPDRALIFIDALRGDRADFYIMPLASVRYLRIGKENVKQLMGEVEIVDLGQPERVVKTPINPQRKPIRTGSPRP